MYPVQRTDKLKVNWRQAAGEALLLLLGVLLALGGQAWWEARVERENSREYVDNLLLEVQENRAGLDRLIDRHSRYIAAGTSMLNEIQGGRADASADVILEQLRILGFFSDFRPATSALNNLVGSGGFNLIDSSELRLAILKYAQGIDDHNVLQGEQTDFFLQTFVPVLGKSIPLLDLQYVRDLEGLPTQSAFKFDPTILVETMEFENLIVRRVSAERDALTYAQSLLELTSELQTLLQNKS